MYVCCRFMTCSMPHRQPSRAVAWSTSTQRTSDMSRTGRNGSTTEPTSRNEKNSSSCSRSSSQGPSTLSARVFVMGSRPRNWRRLCRSQASTWQDIPLSECIHRCNSWDWYSNSDCPSVRDTPVKFAPSVRTVVMALNDSGKTIKINRINLTYLLT